MNKSFILLWMIFMHIVDDYRLQGILASMKQKSWWKEQPQYKPMYKRDYIAVFAHALIQLGIYDHAANHVPE